jgi:HPr kinase/phosphorylase
MLSVKVEKLLKDSEYSLSLELVAGQAGIGRRVALPRIQKPGLALAGYTEQVQSERLQVLGYTELSFLRTLPVDEQAVAVERLFGLEPAVVVVTRGLEVPAVVTQAAERFGVALLRTALPSSIFIDRVTSFLEDQLSPTTSLHGVLVDVLGVGILFLGKSGIGKSEAALDLVLRGHRLIADDIVDLRRKGGMIYGTGSEIIKHHMEIRGLGIINVKDLFGIAAVRDSKKVELIVELVDWNEEEEYDRLGIEDLTYNILDVVVSMLRIPVRPGRDIASIIEVAARNQLLKIQGHDSARDFQDRLNRAIAEARPQSRKVDEVE